MYCQEDGDEFIRRWKEDIRRRRERYRKEVLKAVKGAKEEDAEEEEEEGMGLKTLVVKLIANSLTVLTVIN